MPTIVTTSTSRGQRNKERSAKDASQGHEGNARQAMTCDHNSLSPLLLSAEEAATFLGISRRHFYGLHSSGRLGPLPVKLGSSVRWRRDEIETWVAHGCPARQQWQQMKETLR